MVSAKHIYILLFNLFVFNNIHAQSGQLDVNFNSIDNSDTSSMGARPSFVSTISEQSDKMLIIAGNFMQYNGVPRDRVARIYPDGSLDTGFYPRIPDNWYLFSSAIQEDGKILIGGASPTLFRLTPDGALDSSFSPGIANLGWVTSIQIQPDQKILIADGSDVYRLMPNGDRDTSFQSSISGAKKAILQPDGRILICGSLDDGFTSKRLSVRRLLANGSIDTTFKFPGEANWEFGDIKLQKDGKLIVVGGFTSINGVERSRIARLHTNGSVDLSFNPSYINNSIITTEIQKDGKILCGGYFTNVNGEWVSKLARLNTDGSTDLSFNSGAGANAEVYDIHIQSDDKTIICGEFTAFNKINKNRIARIYNSIGCAYDSSAFDTLVCKSYLWPITNETYTQSGVYVKTYQNRFNCDSIYVLYLTVNTFNKNITIQDNELVASDATAKYQWINCNTNETIADAHQQRFKPTTTGRYAVILSNLEGQCVDTSNCIQFETLGMTQLQKNNIKIYPVPTQNELNVTLCYPSHLWLYSIEGKLLAAWPSASSFTLDLSVFPAGLYFLRTETGAIKILKE